MRALKRCPFCGSARTNVHYNDSRSGKRFYYVSCDVCGSRTRGEAVNVSGETSQEKIDIAKDRSIAAWNQRTVITDA